ncbi:ATP-binding protein, partial [Paraburkholderia caribensis]
MLRHPTIEKLHELGLSGMAAALTEQPGLADIEAMSFEERLGLLVERESSVRESRQTTARLRRAKLKLPDAVPEDIDYRSARGLDRSLIGQLLTCNWIRERNSTVIIGATGLGKTWLSCALANQACRQGFSTLYLKMPRLNEDLAIAHGSGRYARLLAQWAKTDVLLMDDFAMAPMSDGAVRDLLEILDDRHGHRSTLVTSQILRGRPRKICNALNNLMRSPLARTPLPSASNGLPSMRNMRR